MTHEAILRKNAIAAIDKNVHLEIGAKWYRRPNLRFARIAKTTRTLDNPPLKTSLGWCECLGYLYSAESITRLVYIRLDRMSDGQFDGMGGMFEDTSYRGIPSDFESIVPRMPWTEVLRGPINDPVEIHREREQRKPMHDYWLGVDAQRELKSQREAAEKLRAEQLAAAAVLAALPPPKPRKKWWEIFG